MPVAFLLMISPIRGLARLGAVARHATPATNQVTRLGEVRVVGAEVAHAAGIDANGSSHERGDAIGIYDFVALGVRKTLVSLPP